MRFVASLGSLLGLNLFSSAKSAPEKTIAAAMDRADLEEERVPNTSGLAHEPGTLPRNDRAIASLEFNLNTVAADLQCIRNLSDFLTKQNETLGSRIEEELISNPKSRLAKEWQTQIDLNKGLLTQLIGEQLGTTQNGGLYLELTKLYDNAQRDKIHGTQALMEGRADDANRLMNQAYQALTATDYREKIRGAVLNSKRVQLDPEMGVSDESLELILRFDDFRRIKTDPIKLPAIPAASTTNAPVEGDFRSPQHVREHAREQGAAAGTETQATKNPVALAAINYQQRVVASDIECVLGVIKKIEVGNRQLEGELAKVPMLAGMLTDEGKDLQDKRARNEAALLMLRGDPEKGTKGLLGQLQDNLRNSRERVQNAEVLFDNKQFEQSNRMFQRAYQVVTGRDHRMEIRADLAAAGVTAPGVDQVLDAHDLRRHEPDPLGQANPKLPTEKQLQEAVGPAPSFPASPTARRVASAASAPVEEPLSAEFQQAYGGQQINPQFLALLRSQRRQMSDVALFVQNNVERVRQENQEAKQDKADSGWTGWLMGQTKAIDERIAANDAFLKEMTGSASDAGSGGKQALVFGAIGESKKHEAAAVAALRSGNMALAQTELQASLNAVNEQSRLAMWKDIKSTSISHGTANIEATQHEVAVAEKMGTTGYVIDTTGKACLVASSFLAPAVVMSLVTVAPELVATGTVLSNIRRGTILVNAASRASQALASFTGVGAGLQTFAGTVGGGIVAAGEVAGVQVIGDYARHYRDHALEGETASGPVSEVAWREALGDVKRNIWHNSGAALGLAVTNGMSAAMAVRAAEQAASGVTAAATTTSLFSRVAAPVVRVMDRVSETVRSAPVIRTIVNSRLGQAISAYQADEAVIIGKAVGGRAAFTSAVWDSLYDGYEQNEQTKHELQEMAAQAQEFIDRNPQLTDEQVQQIEDQLLAQVNEAPKGINAQLGLSILTRTIGGRIGGGAQAKRDATDILARNVFGQAVRGKLSFSEIVDGLSNSKAKWHAVDVGGNLANSLLMGGVFSKEMFLENAKQIAMGEIAGAFAARSNHKILRNAQMRRALNGHDGGPGSGPTNGPDSGGPTSSDPSGRNGGPPVLPGPGGGGGSAASLPRSGVGGTLGVELNESAVHVGPTSRADTPPRDARGQLWRGIGRGIENQANRVAENDGFLNTNPRLQDQVTTYLVVDRHQLGRLRDLGELHWFVGAQNKVHAEEAFREQRRLHPTQDLVLIRSKVGNLRPSGENDPARFIREGEMMRGTFQQDATHGRDYEIIGAADPRKRGLIRRERSIVDATPAEQQTIQERQNALDREAAGLPPLETVPRHQAGFIRLLFSPIIDGPRVLHETFNYYMDRGTDIVPGLRAGKGGWRWASLDASLHQDTFGRGGKFYRRGGFRALSVDQQDRILASRLVPNGHEHMPLVEGGQQWALGISERRRLMQMAKRDSSLSVQTVEVRELRNQVLIPPNNTIGDNAITLSVLPKPSDRRHSVEQRLRSGGQVTSGDADEINRQLTQAAAALRSGEGAGDQNSLPRPLTDLEVEQKRTQLIALGHLDAENGVAFWTHPSGRKVSGAELDNMIRSNVFPGAEGFGVAVVVDSYYQPRRRDVREVAVEHHRRLSRLQQQGVVLDEVHDIPSVLDTDIQSGRVLFGNAEAFHGIAKVYEVRSETFEPANTRYEKNHSFPTGSAFIHPEFESFCLESQRNGYRVVADTGLGEDRHIVVDHERKIIRLGVDADFLDVVGTQAEFEFHRFMQSEVGPGRTFEQYAQNIIESGQLLDLESRNPTIARMIRESTVSIPSQRGSYIGALISDDGLIVRGASNDILAKIYGARCQIERLPDKRYALVGTEERKQEIVDDVYRSTIRRVVELPTGERDQADLESVRAALQARRVNGFVSDDDIAINPLAPGRLLRTRDVDSREVPAPASASGREDDDIPVRRERVKKQDARPERLPPGIAEEKSLVSSLEEARVAVDRILARAELTPELALSARSHLVDAYHHLLTPRARASVVRRNNFHGATVPAAADFDRNLSTAENVRFDEQARALGLPTALNGEARMEEVSLNKIVGTVEGRAWSDYESPSTPTGSHISVLRGKAFRLVASEEGLSSRDHSKTVRVFQLGDAYFAENGAESIAALKGLGLSDRKIVAEVVRIDRRSATPEQLVSDAIAALPRGEQLTVGEGCDIVVQDPRLQGQHVTFYKDLEGQVSVVTGKPSEYGTFISTRERVGRDLKQRLRRVHGLEQVDSGNGIVTREGVFIYLPDKPTDQKSLARLRGIQQTLASLGDGQQITFDRYGNQLTGRDAIEGGQVTLINLGTNPDTGKRRWGVMDGSRILAGFARIERTQNGQVEWVDQRRNVTSQDKVVLGDGFEIEIPDAIVSVSTRPSRGLQLGDLVQSGKAAVERGQSMSQEEALATRLLALDALKKVSDESCRKRKISPVSDVAELLGKDVLELPPVLTKRTIEELQQPATDREPVLTSEEAYALTYIAELARQKREYRMSQLPSKERNFQKFDAFSLENREVFDPLEAALSKLWIERDPDAVRVDRGEIIPMRLRHVSQVSHDVFLRHLEEAEFISSDEVRDREGLVGVRVGERRLGSVELSHIVSAEDGISWRERMSGDTQRLQGLAGDILEGKGNGTPFSERITLARMGNRYVVVTGADEVAALKGLGRGDLKIDADIVTLYPENGNISDFIEQRIAEKRAGQILTLGGVGTRADVIIEHPSFNDGRMVTIRTMGDGQYEVYPENRLPQPVYVKGRMVPLTAEEIELLRRREGWDNNRTEKLDLRAPFEQVHGVVTVQPGQSIHVERSGDMRGYVHFRIPDEKVDTSKLGEFEKAVRALKPGEGFNITRSGSIARVGTAIQGNLLTLARTDTDQYKLIVHEDVQADPGLRLRLADGSWTSARPSSEYQVGEALDFGNNLVVRFPRSDSTSDWRAHSMQARPVNVDHLRLRSLADRPTEQFPELIGARFGEVAEHEVRQLAESLRHHCDLLRRGQIQDLLAELRIETVGKNLPYEKVHFSANDRQGSDFAVPELASIDRGLKSIAQADRAATKWVRQSDEDALTFFMRLPRGAGQQIIDQTIERVYPDESTRPSIEAFRALPADDPNKKSIMDRLEAIRALPEEPLLLVGHGKLPLEGRQHTGDEGSAGQQRLQEIYQRETATLHLLSELYAYREMLGQPLSRQGVLLRRLKNWRDPSTVELDKMADCVQFAIEQGVPVSNFVMNELRVRESLEVVNKPFRDSGQARVEQLLASLPLGVGEINLGTRGDIRVQFSDHGKRNAPRRPRQLEVQPLHLTVDKVLQENGEIQYRLRDHASGGTAQQNSETFIFDESLGRWRVVAGEEIVPANTLVRMNGYEFRLRPHQELSGPHSAQSILPLFSIDELPDDVKAAERMSRHERGVSETKRKKLEGMQRRLQAIQEGNVVTRRDSDDKLVENIAKLKAERPELEDRILQLDLYVMLLKKAKAASSGPELVPPPPGSGDGSSSSGSGGVDTGGSGSVTGSLSRPPFPDAPAREALPELSEPTNILEANASRLNSEATLGQLARELREAEAHLALVKAATSDPEALKVAHAGVEAAKADILNTGRFKKRMEDELRKGIQEDEASLATDKPEVNGHAGVREASEKYEEAYRQRAAHEKSQAEVDAQFAALQTQISEASAQVQGGGDDLYDAVVRPLHEKQNELNQQKRELEKSREEIDREAIRRRVELAHARQKAREELSGPVRKDSTDNAGDDAPKQDKNPTPKQLRRMRRELTTGMEFETVEMNKKLAQIADSFVNEGDEHQRTDLQQEVGLHRERIARFEAELEKLPETLPRKTVPATEEKTQDNRRDPEAKGKAEDGKHEPTPKSAAGEDVSKRIRQLSEGGSLTIGRSKVEAGVSHVQIDQKNVPKSAVEVTFLDGRYSIKVLAKGVSVVDPSGKRIKAKVNQAVFAPEGSTIKLSDDIEAVEVHLPTKT